MNLYTPIFFDRNEESLVNNVTLLGNALQFVYEACNIAPYFCDVTAA